MGECVYQMGDDAKMLKAMTDPMVVSQYVLANDWTVESLLHAVANITPVAHALIDTGALITGMSNREVAGRLCDLLPSEMEGVVYLEQGGHKKILLKAGRRPMDLERCGVPKEKRFSFFDQVHTTGMDIPQGASARAILTLGKDLTFRDYAQGAYRMRGIGKGQRIILFIIPEVQRLLSVESALGLGCTAAQRHSQLSGMPEAQRRKHELEDIASWLVLNSMRSERIQFELWCLQCAQNTWRKRALERLREVHAQFGDAREGKGAQLEDRKRLDVFRVGIERDVSNTVPQVVETRQQIVALANQNAALLQPDDVRTVHELLVCH